MLEKDIQKACLEFLRFKGIYSWRQNTTGVFNKKSGGYFFHGLSGVADILGITNKGIFLAIEVKQPGKNPTQAQNEFLDAIAENGGIAICAHSVDELEAYLKELKVI